MNHLSGNAAVTPTELNVPSICMEITEKVRQQNARLNNITDVLFGPKLEKKDTQNPPINSLIDALKYINEMAAQNNPIITQIERALGV